MARQSDLVDGERLERMTDSMRHRGPDGGATHVFGRVGFGHRRLSIIDLDNGAQPMPSADGTIWVTYNGEIYNFRELREELEAAGRTFRTNCDTEVIVEGYAAWGEALFAKLAGMFAFALHDTRDGKLVLVRDRLGIKPLYYAVSGGSLVFGSEIRALFASDLISPEPEPDLIDAFVSLGYVPGERTLFRGVNKIEPGSYLVVDDASPAPRTHAYWDLAATEPVECDYEQAKRGFVDLFARVCERHLISDVPLGAFLSGGVDSSAVVAFVREELGLPLATFSVGYHDDPVSSELGHARRVAERFATDHHEFILTREGFFAGIDTLIEHSEEPIVESAGVALMGLAKFASEHATVFLSGEGSDEVFAGYDLYGRTFQLERLRRVLFPLRSAGVRAAIGGAVPNERLVKYFDWVGMPFEQRYRTIPADVTPSIRTRMYGAPRADGLDGMFADLFGEVAHRDQLARMQYADIKTWLVDDLLLKADKMTMAASVELRVPFLDHEVVEFGFGLPAEHKRRDGAGKALLKEIVARYLPRDLVYRPKQGFPVPVSKWLREDLYEPASRILLDPHSLERGYFRPEYVRRCLERHRAGKEDLGRRLVSLLVLERWHRRWFEGAEALAIQ